MKIAKSWKSVALMMALAGGALPGVFGGDAPMGMTAAHAQAGGISVLLNGQLLNLGVTGASQVNGRVLVPLRGVFEALGAAVDYDPATMTVFATRADTQMQLRIGSTQANVNGQVRILDVPAQTRFGRTLVPLRFVSEALGASVSWNDAQRAVYIVSAGGGATLPGEPTLPPPVAPPETPPVTQPVVQREKVSGVVAGAVVSNTAFVLRTDDGVEMTVRTEAQLPRSLSEFDRVQVSGTRDGDDFNAETLTIETDVRPFRGEGEVTRVTRRQLTVEFTGGETMAVIPTANSVVVQVGDNVRVNGFSDGQTVRNARVTLRDNAGTNNPADGDDTGDRNDRNDRNDPDGRNDRNDRNDRNGRTNPDDRNNPNTPDNPPPVASGVKVDFTGSVESVDLARRTMTVRGDNGQTYTVAYNRVAQFTRNQRVRVQGTYLDGVTTARVVTGLDN